MHTNDLTNLIGAARSGPAAPAAAADADRSKIRALAEQFESMLLAQMLKEMKQAMSPEADEPGLGGPIIGDTISTELAMALARSDRFGVSQFIGDALARMDGHEPVGAAPSPAPEYAPLPAPVPPAAPVHGGESAAVTSRYGWRVDPLNGQHRFHAGLDLRAAYGQDVRAATDGEVTFAGEKPGYGMVVVVSHGSGLETRYAHLSTMDVAEGARVAAGQVIARSGNSGRATGPHLHFEVRQDGQPVDPAVVAGLVPAVTARPRTAD